MVLFDLVLFLLTALGVTFWAGYAPARLLLRGPLADLRLPMMAPLGLASIIVVAVWLNATVLPLQTATPVILLAATAANFYLIITTRRAGFHVGVKDGVLICLALLTYALGVTPLLNAGSTAFVGVQWDLEIYLPLTEYLKTHVLWGPVAAHANPLLEQVNGPAVRGGSGLGFSSFEALVGSVLGWESFRTFRPTLQFVFGLTPFAIYAFCRGGLGMGSAASLIAAGLAGFNGLNLWVASMGLAGHTIALVLLPVALTATRWVLGVPSARTALLAGLVLAGMLLSFYTGALVVYAPAAAVLAVVLVDGARRRASGGSPSVRAQVAAIGGTGLAVVAMALPGHVRFLELVPLYARLGFSGGWNVQEFSAIGEGLGLAPYRLVIDRLGESLFWGLLPLDGVHAGSSVLAAGAIGLCLTALLRRGWDRSTFACLLAAVVVAGLYLRVSAPYPYGFFKLLSLTGFILIAGLVQGSASVWSALPSRGAALRVVVASFWAPFIALGAVNTATSLHYFWTPDPHELPRSVWQLDALQALVPPDSPVYFPAQEGPDRSLTAMVAYFFRNNPLVGHLRSQYGRLPPARPDADFDYVALLHDRRAWELGLNAEDRVWANEVLSVYRRPADWLTSVDLASTQDAMAIQDGDELTISLGNHDWAISNGSERIRGRYRTPGPVAQQADLLIAAFGEPEVRVQHADGTERRSLPSGFVSFRTPPLEAPATIRLAPADGRPAWLMGLRVSAEPGEAHLRRGEHLLLVQPEVQIAGSVADLRLDYLFNDGRKGYGAAALELYRRTGGGGRDPRATAFWRMGDLRGPAQGQVQLSLDFASGSCSTGNALPRSPRQPGKLDLQPGTYEAHLVIYYVNEEVLRWPWVEIEVGPDTAVRQLPHRPYGVVNLDPPRDLDRLRAALPHDARVYAPAGPHPTYSFIPVAQSVLTQPWIGRAREGAPDYALLPAGEDPRAYGVSGYDRVWSNGEAGLYRLSPGAAPAPRAAPGELLLQELVEATGSRVSVRLPNPSLFDPGTIVGIDIYGERPCGLEHYGYWATPVSALDEGGSVIMDLGRQRGSVEGARQTYSETWTPSDGRYRAFLFTKQGDHFETAPLFDFAWSDGAAHSVTAFPVARLRVDGIMR